MKKILSIILSSVAMVSCIDTVLLPDDKTVEEDFWQTKSQVAEMVNGAYASMASADLQMRFVIWTSRSDELNLRTSLNNSALNQINSANIQTTNGFANWNNLYSVINNCNLVIDKSAEVMDIDPNYLEGDHRNYVAQMKSLRALAYFYLVRVFRDVPLILTPYKESSAEMNIPQVAPAVVIDQIIADLEEVKDHTLSTQGIGAGDWTRYGYFTRDAVYALLADIYLWKAAVYNDEPSYDKVIQYADVIRKNRSNATGGMRPGFSMLSFDDDGWGLNPYYNYYDLFAMGGNDAESIFELQQATNTGLSNVYYKLDNSATSQPYFYASQVYSNIANDDNHVFKAANMQYDVRGYESVYNFNSGVDGDIYIRKFVASLSSSRQNTAPNDTKETAREDRQYTAYAQNWIFYRVTDVMLMKAEALVEKARIRLAANAGLATEMEAAQTPQDSLAVAEKMRLVNVEIAGYNVNAARQVQITSTRARQDEKSEMDSTKYAFTGAEYSGEASELTTYIRTQINTFSGFEGTLDELELAIMDERARELCFEGKRWFDMLRYNYRHATGVNYNTILADQGGNYAKNYDAMLKLIARKYSSGGGSGVTSKMLTEPYLYMPIIQGEVDVNPALKQNPVYSDGGTTEKNY